MNLIKPVGLTFLSASEAEDDAPVWDAGTTFNLGNQVIRGGLLYVSSINGNVAIDPATEVQELEGARWVLIGATNVRRFLDGILSSKTTGATPLVLEAECDGYFNTVALFNLVCTEATIEAIVGGQTVATETLKSGAEPVGDWWSWLNTVFKPARRRVILPNFAGVAGAKIRLTIEGPSPAIGSIFAGRTFKIGKTLLDNATRVRRRTFTELVTDAFGATKATKRAVARDVTYRVTTKRATFAEVEAVLDEVEGVPVVTYEDTLAQELVNFGYLLNIELPSDMPDDFFTDVTCQGVI